MVNIEIEEVQRIFARLQEIDAIPFSEVNWLKDGKPLVLSPDLLEDFNYTGMPNTAFVDLRLYEEH